MRMTSTPHALRRRLRAEDGFTMIVALGVMLVTSLFLIVAFTVAEGDVHLSREDTNQKQAYYAALAGVQAYEQQLQVNPNYWETCEGPKSTVLEEASESFEVKVLPASTAPKGTTECSAANAFGTVIESEGALTNTFRIKSTGKAKTAGYQGSAQRSIIATFKVVGFLDYIYFTNYEQEDPIAAKTSSKCEKKWYSEWQAEKLSCQEIQFATGDAVNGPMHTNDAADVGGSATFGREGHSPADVVEINGGTYPTEGCGEGVSAKYYTATKCFTKGGTLLPPESDSSLETYVEAANRFSGLTHLELKGSTSQIVVSYFKEEKEVKETIAWPKNGLLYVKAGSGGCGYTYEPENSDSKETEEKEKGCGNVYVNGTYSKSLTVGGEGEVIINGNLYPTSVEGKLGEKPSGTTVLGLIASKFVRIYHPCSGSSNQTGSLKDPWIYAGILSTSHSFIVDNFSCGAELGKLHVYGAIAQNYRGPVGTGGGGGGTGYFKDYKYDDRLAAAEPPYFIAPLKAGWKVARQTAPEPG